MENKLIGLRDPHLNVFYAYGDKAHLENNITKAFVNTLESFSEKELKKTIKELFDFELPEGEISVTFYLQKKPSESMVEKYPNRIMFAFSPTGKPWGIEGLDTKNEKEIKDALLELAKNQSEIEEEQEEFVKNTLEEILKIRENNGSIPDGWLFVDIDNIPTLVVAMENKLYDLDPYQLNNHIEKSLLIFKEEDKPKPVYSTYDKILELFKELDLLLCNQFIEYLTILGYTKVDDFSIACRADKQIRQRLVREFGEEILEIVHEGKKDFRHWETARCHVDYDYLHEINLKFDSNSVELWLSFGPTQYCAKQMLSRIDNITINDDHFSRFHQGFHLQYQRGRIINDSYLGKWELDEYIKYWKENIEYIRTSSPEGILVLCQKMLSDGKISSEELENMNRRFSGKKNPVLVIPEISLVFSWSYEEAANIGLEQLGKSIKEKVDLSLKEMKII